ncbi:DEAD/DEAH box helicase [Planotetraspora sp. A-T 1434]|uniref:DEAD/DEAH box helicase n=1 Tax=Planotetraspora sp. A-T 1434 TaxID=2979219 RepID=UPI0021BE0569|nr:DEAD/DEAH box helicase [Planotetraspora sp. A-T 1434]MCT9932778.1 DEAD/DEAH box helicase [Planotetraspora sp. A-T 1434]
MLDSGLPETIDSGLPEVLDEFTLLGLPKPLVAGLARQGITSPFPIQRAAIPDILAGHDVLGRGQTGSGKTLAFGLPTMARIAGEKALPKRPRAIVLVPTRELALQVADAIEPLGRGLSLRVKTVVGGMSMGKQIDALRRGVEIVVATPGRLTDLIEQGECSLQDVQVSVLDEADHMCDLGFFPVVSAILDKTPADSQRLLFSATLDGDVDKLVRRFLTDPVTHSLDPATSSVETMEHHLVQVHRDDKVDVTAEIANREGRTILFVRTQHGVDRVVKQLARVGVRAGGLHGGKRQNQRTRILSEFREGNVKVLVCTDVAARGIHVDDVSLVLHVDPPMDHKSYLHRGGRTARAGERGSVVTLITPNERRSTDSMTRRAGINPSRHRVAPGDPILAEIAGARRPSGEAIPVWEPDVRKPLRPKRDDHPGGERRPRRFGDRRGRDGDGPRRDRPEGAPRRDRADGGFRREGEGFRRGSDGFRRDGESSSRDRAAGDGRPAEATPYRRRNDSGGSVRDLRGQFREGSFRSSRGGSADDRSDRGAGGAGGFGGERRDRGGDFRGDRGGRDNDRRPGDGRDNDRRPGDGRRGDAHGERGRGAGSDFRDGARPFRESREGGSVRDGDRASGRGYQGDRQRGSSNGDGRYDRRVDSRGDSRGGYQTGGYQGSGYQGSGYQGSGYQGSGYQGSGYQGERGRGEGRSERRPDSRGESRAPYGGGFRQGGRPTGRTGGHSGNRFTGR